MHSLSARSFKCSSFHGGGRRFSRLWYGWDIYLPNSVSFEASKLILSSDRKVANQTRLKLVIDRFDMEIKLEECLCMSWGHHRREEQNEQERTFEMQ